MVEEVEMTYDEFRCVISMFKWAKIGSISIKLSNPEYEYLKYRYMVNIKYELKDRYVVPGSDRTFSCSGKNCIFRIGEEDEYGSVVCAIYRMAGLAYFSNMNELTYYTNNICKLSLYQLLYLKRNVIWKDT